MSLGRTIVLGCLLLLGGCGAERSHRMLDGGATASVQQDAGYTLLLSLLEDESRVDGILMIKSLPEPVVRLVKAISEASRSGVQRITEVLEEPPVVTPGNDGLPLIEVEARARIRQWTTVALLTGSGTALERALLVSQLQAVDSIRALCEALIEQETSAPRVAVLEQALESFTGIRARVWARLAEVGD